MHCKDSVLPCGLSTARPLAGPETRTLSDNSYHHGNLRAVVLEDAIATVEASGPQSLSLRQLARNAGVSSTATYSHFKNKRELLAAVANAGFERLYDVIASSTQGSAGQNDQLRGAMEGMVGFALENPGIYALMFGEELSGYSGSQALWVSMSKTYEALETAVRNTLPAESVEPDVRLATYACWSKAHGLALLLLNGKIAPTDTDPEERGQMIKRILSFPV